MSEVHFDPDARADFLAVIEYYEECEPGLGRRFRQVTEGELKHIRDIPLRFRVLHDPFRRCLLPNFPYAIVFSIEPEFILVIAVAHLKRKPGYWADRISKYR